jgi:signal transduction histidine kinase/ActR/RegA family two-component response regulator
MGIELADIQASLERLCALDIKEMGSDVEWNEGCSASFIHKHRCVYNEMLDAIPTLIWAIEKADDIVQPEGKNVVYVNKMFRDTLGVGDVEFMPWKNIVHPEDIELVLMNIFKLITNKVQEYEILHRYKHYSAPDEEDNYRWYMCRGVRIQINGRNMFSGSVVDVHSTVQLEKRNRELAIKDEAMQSAMKLKRDFISLISHETKTPLNAIMGMVSLLLATDLSNVQLEYVNTVHNAVKVLASTVDDILEFALLESKHIVLGNDILNVEEIMRDVLNLMHSLCKQKNVKVIFTKHNTWNPIRYGDAARIKQVFLNILGNAVKFTSEGFVYIDMFCDDEESDIIRIDFKDTGIGMSKDVENILFEAFVQGDLSLSRKYGGLGLGMYICKKVIDMMNGIIGIASQEGKGTLITLSLPLPPANVLFDTRESQGLQDIHQADLEELKKKLTILYAEDNQVNQIIMKKYLERLGYQNVTIVKDGQEAVDEWEKGRWNIIMLDQSMPRMNGDEVCRWIRKRDEDQIMISVSANALAKDIAKFSEPSMNDYISKPVSLNDLDMKLKKWISYLYMRSGESASRSPGIL